MNGVDVPHYCWHPKLSIDGSCRLCQVEVEGCPKLQIACNTPVQDGMVVRTEHAARAAGARGRDGAPARQPPARLPDLRPGRRVQAPGLRLRVRRLASRSREPRRALKKNVSLGPTIVFDQERCILCRRCVRFTREISETGELVVRTAATRR
jgi:NADH-quinone oxidoreductase subunit G